MPPKGFGAGRLIPWAHRLVLLATVSGLMLRWFGGAMPLSPRGENLPQLSHIWMLQAQFADGSALSGWNPLVLGENPPP